MLSLGACSPTSTVVSFKIRCYLKGKAIVSVQVCRCVCTQCFYFQCDCVLYCLQHSQ